MINALLTPVFQLCLFLAPFYAALKLWDRAALWTGGLLVMIVVLYFTWYRQLPPYNTAPEEHP